MWVELKDFSVNLGFLANSVRVSTRRHTIASLCFCLISTIAIFAPSPPNTRKTYYVCLFIKEKKKTYFAFLIYSKSIRKLGRPILQYISAEVPVLYYVSYLFLHVFCIDDYLLLRHIGRVEGNLVQHPLHYRVESPRAYVLG